MIRHKLLILCLLHVIPAKAGTHFYSGIQPSSGIDPRLRGDDRITTMWQLDRQGFFNKTSPTPISPPHSSAPASK